MLGSLREYETALLAQPDTDPGMPLLEHCFQTAEACRVAYPKEEEDWFALVGLIHQLGKLLGHARCAHPALLTPNPQLQSDYSTRKGHHGRQYLGWSANKQCGWM